MFSLGLLVAVVAAVAGLGAQSRFTSSRQDRPVEPGIRPAANVMMLDGRGSQLGVMVSDVDVKAADRRASKVDEVNEDSPAEKAGIKAGDVVVEYDGERVRSARQFTRLVQETPEGRTVAIGLLRDGKKQTVERDAGERPDDLELRTRRRSRDARRPSAGMRGFRFDVRTSTSTSTIAIATIANRGASNTACPEAFMPFAGRSRGRLGVTVQSLTPELEEYFGATNGGALVSSVTKESAAAKAGIKAGDVIASINGRPRRRLRRPDSTSSSDADRRGDDCRLARQEGDDAEGDIERRQPTPRAGSDLACC